MDWWIDFVIITIIGGIIVLIISHRVEIRNKNKNDEEEFNFEIKKLSNELDSTFQGSGDEFPLHTSCLKNIFKN